MAKKKNLRKAVKRKAQKGLFEKHPDLLWLLLAFILICFLLVFFK